MSAKGRIVAVLAAAGLGARFGRTGGKQVPKQFLELAGKPLYLWPLGLLCQHRSIASVIVPTAIQMVADVEQELEQAGLAGKVEVIAGGATRQESIWESLCHLGRKLPVPEYVVIHDAARPFLTRRLLDDTIAAVVDSGACTVGIPVFDTVKRVEDGKVKETIERQSLFLVQTPQAARFQWLQAAHGRAREKGIATTDDAAVLEQAGYSVVLVAGSAYNIKVTRQEDLAIARLLAGRLEK